MLNQPAIKSSLSSHANNKHTLTIEPLMPGYGYTLGNSIRRVMLSSIPGFAVTKIKINDITHEYQALDGVVEDALDVILNLKNLRSKIITDDEEVTIELKKKKEGEVTAADFEKNAKVEIVNPDLYICTINKSVELNIELTVSKGVSYLSVDQIDFNNSNPQEIVVDALFSAVTNVALNVEKVRVGENTNYDKISIDFDTDGTIEPNSIVDFTMKTVIDLFQKIHSSFLTGGAVELDSIEPEDVSVVKVQEDAVPENEPIALPKTILKILEKNDITALNQLVERKDEVKDFPGITEAHIKKITKLLSE